MTIKKMALATTAVTAALALSACGGGEATGSAGQAPPAPTSSAAGQQVSADHNDADIAFAQGMIPHHRQAVDMANLAADRAESDQVKQLATAIQQAQGPEIQQLQGFLAAWGAPESGDMPGMGQEHNMPGMEQNGMSGMSGMMSDQQMQQLEQASGVEFDRMWLQMMIAHHEGAVQMAQTELRDGRNPEAKALAQKIIDAQQTEITQMQEMLG
ncbi:MULTISPECIES: DUF305 domain-containing protein [Pseudonocardia]|uniref:DUF305 domain-containing protein n=2 Tax=Pseudonocardia TaxID=1847 RepID=A0A1Y2MHF6_PSEAH|nr:MULTISPECIES: DUF305 domain-containing protein [Pseudonocardia]OSY34592.1 hypothetical protein BG845_06698 [Pseudonocardia autotrophica]TDN65557.1 uncharacterized protein (DUF305 family) [Pseudonocardia autotrophica]BBG05688.1 lipoprotein [Pseudonocardia autotrophica]GEC29626.1 lipoprotein [Pseudonocardia saturnea]